MGLKEKILILSFLQNCLLNPGCVEVSILLKTLTGSATVVIHIYIVTIMRSYVCKEFL